VSQNVGQRVTNTLQTLKEKISFSFPHKITSNSKQTTLEAHTQTSLVYISSLALATNKFS